MTKKGTPIKHTVWNKGLTKETDERIMKAAINESLTKKSMNITTWNKGLTGIYSEETIAKMKKAAETTGCFATNNPMNDLEKRKLVSLSKVGRKMITDEFGNKKLSPRLDK